MSNATELLRRARNVFGNCRGDDAEDLFDEICTFLAAEPEAEYDFYGVIPLTHRKDACTVAGISTEQWYRRQAIEKYGKARAGGKRRQD